MIFYETEAFNLVDYIFKTENSFIDIYGEPRGIYDTRLSDLAS